MQQRTSLVDHSFQAGNEGVDALESKALLIAEFFLEKIFQAVAFRQFLRDIQHLVLGTLGRSCLNFGPEEMGLPDESLNFYHVRWRHGGSHGYFEQRTVN